MTRNNFCIKLDLTYSVHAVVDLSRQLPRISRKNPRPPLPKLILDNINMINNHLSLPTHFFDLILLRPGLFLFCEGGFIVHRCWDGGWFFKFKLD